MKRFYTADLHFNHVNVMKHCERPFENVEQMNEEIIRRWNSRVHKNDEIYVLGDIAWVTSWDRLTPFTSRLNGKIHLIKGNHDTMFVKGDMTKSPFVWIKDIAEIKDKANGEEYRVVLCHFPMLSWNARMHGSLHLYGHVHNSPMDFVPKNAFNVGVDVWNFEPVTLEEILNRE